MYCRSGQCHKHVRCECLIDLYTTRELSTCKQLNANIAIHNVQRETLDTLRSSSSNTEELLYQILTNQEAMRDIVRMEREGNPVAERIMEAGQLVSRQSNSSFI